MFLHLLQHRVEKEMLDLELETLLSSIFLFTIMMTSILSRMN